MKNITKAAALAAALLVSLTGCVFTPGPVNDNSEPATTPVEQQVEEVSVETAEVEAEAEAEAPVETEPELTMGQKNAIDKAESYLDFMAFSRQGLIEQLEYEGFSTEDATFAVDNIEVDWNEQAALKAESYLEFSSFSRQGLIDQLLFEGFTQEQAEYGVSAVGY